MDRKQVCTGESGRACSTLDLMRNVIELKVQENLETKGLELLDDGRALGIVERHADLDPGGLTGKSMSQFQGSIAIAIERDDHAVACVSI